MIRIPLCTSKILFKAIQTLQRRGRYVVLHYVFHLEISKGGGLIYDIEFILLLINNINTFSQ